jgi:hypothetical protein
MACWYNLVCSPPSACVDEQVSAEPKLCTQDTGNIAAPHGNILMQRCAGGAGKVRCVAGSWHMHCKWHSVIEQHGTPPLRLAMSGRSVLHPLARQCGHACADMMCMVIHMQKITKLSCRLSDRHHSIHSCRALLTGQLQRRAAPFASLPRVRQTGSGRRSSGVRVMAGGRITGKTVVVTGAGRGIGLEVRIADWSAHLLKFAAPRCPAMACEGSL